jgi:hypothetical protein
MRRGERSEYAQSQAHKAKAAPWPFPRRAYHTSQATGNPLLTFAQVSVRMMEGDPWVAPCPSTGRLIQGHTADRAEPHPSPGRTRAPVQPCGRGLRCATGGDARRLAHIPPCSQGWWATRTSGGWWRPPHADAVCPMRCRSSRCRPEAGLPTGCCAQPTGRSPSPGSPLP